MAAEVWEVADDSEADPSKEIGASDDGDEKRSLDLGDVVAEDGELDDVDENEAVTDEEQKAVQTNADV